MTKHTSFHTTGRQNLLHERDLVRSSDRTTRHHDPAVHDHVLCGLLATVVNEAIGNEWTVTNGTSQRSTHARDCRYDSRTPFRSATGSGTCMLWADASGRLLSSRSGRTACRGTPGALRRPQRHCVRAWAMHQLERRCSGSAVLRGRTRTAVRLTLRPFPAFEYRESRRHSRLRRDGQPPRIVH